jgi:uncharacterized protein YjbI with pentapeptide repeats
MRIFKPLELSLQHKQFSWQGKHHISVSIMIGFPMSGGELLLEQDLWQLIPEALGKDQILDMGMPKPNAEVLVTGKAYAPGKEPVKSSAVGLKVGDIKKELVVYGNRYWGLTGIGEPEKFTQMPVDYAHAFGGKDYKKNPLGIGMDDVDYFGEMRTPLPNIESVDSIISSKGQTPDPAGFAPLDIMWPQRASMIGTYDDKWLQQRAPGYADDLDWRHFNTAPADQWLDGYFIGGEEFYLINMHPQKTKLEGTLPAYRARCFVNQKPAPDGEATPLKQDPSSFNFREIDMKAETLWFLPEAETGLLIYRGTLAVETDDASDIEHMMVAYENLADAQRDGSHYRNALDKRLDPNNGFVHLMDTLEMIPIGARCGFVRMLEDAANQNTENAFAENMEAKAESLKQEIEQKLEEQRQKITQQLTQANIDPAPYVEKLSMANSQELEDPDMKSLMQIVDKIMPGMMDGDIKKLDFKKLDLSKMEDFSLKMDEIADRKKDEARTQIQQIIKELQQSASQSETARLTLEPKIKELQISLENLDKPPELPRPPSLDAGQGLRDQVSAAEQQIEQLRNSGIAEESLPDIDIDMDEIEKDFQLMIDNLKDNYRIGAHYIEGRPPHKEPLDIIQYRFRKTLDKGKSIAGGDYAGINLSGQDLSEIDFSNCYLEYVNFSGANLRNANFKNAILAHANMSRANLQGANLEGANIGDVNLTEANLSTANLQNAKLSKSNLTGAILVQCNLNGVSEILEADLTRVDMSEAILSSISFLKIPLDGARFIKTQMANTNFIHCSLNGADFSGALLDRSNWVGVTADNAVFNEASMQNNRFPDNSSLQQARFIRANIDRSNFRDANLQGADFTEASFEMADFGGANLQRATFYRAVGKRSQFIKADLGGANMSSMNMMEGSLMKARLTNANFCYSNLYAVEFMNATVGGTDFGHANLDLSKLEDWRPSA